MPMGSGELPTMSDEGSFHINWKVVAIVAAPITLVGLAGAYIYWSNSDPSPDSNGPRKPGFDLDTTATDSGTESEDPLTRAIAYKNRGNKIFKGGKYPQAIDCYSKALDICPAENVEERSTFFQNRAAAYENLRDYTKCLADCDSALDLNPRYVKALTRRARMYESLQRLDQCLEDVTAENLTRADRVLKMVGKKKAEEEIKFVKRCLPSKAFVRAYLSAFANEPFVSQTARTKFNRKREQQSATTNQLSVSGDDIISDSVAVSNGNHDDSAGSAEMKADDDEEKPCEGLTAGLEGESDVKVHVEEEHRRHGADTLDRAVESLMSENYEEALRFAKLAVDELEKSCDEEALEDEDLARARLLRGTFHVLCGENDEARVDFDNVMMSRAAAREVMVNALIKRASLYLTASQDISACMETMKRAIEVWPACSDIFHHRGQINLLVDNLEQALSDLDKAVELKPDFSITQSQRLYTKFRILMMGMQMTDANNILREFKNMSSRYPNCMETHSLLAQSLVEKNDFEEASEEFKQVIKLDPSSGTAYVHLGLLQVRWKNDMEKAMEFLLKAIQVDPMCEFAFEMLGTFCVQRAEFDDALRYFNCAIQLTKTEAEMGHLISLREAVKAQTNVCSRYGMTISDVLTHPGMVSGQM